MSQARLKVNRDREVDASMKAISEANKPTDGAKADDTTDVTMAPAEEDEEAAALQAALAMSLASADAPPVPQSPVGPGIPLDFKGNYELFGVVTHKGTHTRRT